MDIELDIGAATNVGKVREHNEDAYAFLRCATADLLIVCDGMGGHASGDVASNLAWRTIASEAVEIGKEGAQDPQLVVLNSIHRAHEAVCETAKRCPEHKGMGTTCVVALIRGNALHLGHVGDSRVYLVRSGVARQRTDDHTKVQEMLRRGILTPEEAKTHPDAGVLAMALGQSKPILPFVEKEPITLVPGDAIVLCTDGAYDSMSLEDIARVTEFRSARLAAEWLVTTATDRDGNDNATAIVAMVRPADTHTDVAPPPRRIAATLVDPPSPPAPPVAAPVVAAAPPPPPPSPPAKPRRGWPFLIGGVFLGGVLGFGAGAAIASTTWCGAGKNVAAAGADAGSPAQSDAGAGQRPLTVANGPTPGASAPTVAVDAGPSTPSLDPIPVATGAADASDAKGPTTKDAGKNPKQGK